MHIRFSGVIGNSARCDGTVLGVAVNTAARLMCHPKATGTVLCTEPMKEQCEESVEFDKGEYVSLKGERMADAIVCMKLLTNRIGTSGNSAPVLVFRAMQTKSVTEHEGNSDWTCKGKPLAGRVKEMKLIDDCIENWRAGKTARIVLSSSSGLGKTALCGYLLSGVTNLEDTVVWSVLCAGYCFMDQGISPISLAKDVRVKRIALHHSMPSGLSCPISSIKSTRAMSKQASWNIDFWKRKTVGTL